MTVHRGFYRHYKGPIYFVEGVGTLHDNTRRVVIYQSTQSAEDGKPRLRYEDDFEAWIHRDGTVAEHKDIDGIPPRELIVIGYVRRFNRIRPRVEVRRVVEPTGEVFYVDGQNEYGCPICSGRYDERGTIPQHDPGCFNDNGEEWSL